MSEFEINTDVVQDEEDNTPVLNDEPVFEHDNATQSIVNGNCCDPVAEEVGENTLAGVVGACLLGLVGCALYILVYRLGYVAGICGLVTVIISNFGYNKFAGTKDSMKGIITAIIVSVIMILLGEYTALAWEIYDAYKPDLTFFDAFRATPLFLEGEVLSAVIKDVVIALALGIIASFATVSRIVKINKAAKK